MPFSENSPNGSSAPEEDDEDEGEEYSPNGSSGVRGGSPPFRLYGFML